jgi:hypothetical protein
MQDSPCGSWLWTVDADFAVGDGFVREGESDDGAGDAAGR